MNVLKKTYFLKYLIIASTKFKAVQYLLPASQGSSEMLFLLLQRFVEISFSCIFALLTVNGGKKEMREKRVIGHETQVPEQHYTSYCGDVACTQINHKTVYW